MKIRRLLLSLMCLACLFGCTTSPVQSTQMQDSETSESANSTEEKRTSETLTFSHNPAGVQTTDGFYSVQYNEDWTGYIVFSDYATKQTVPLCNQPNCKHDSSSCTAWFENPYNVPRILTNGKKLVFCYLGLQGQVYAPAALEIANLDGSDRTILHKFSSNETIYEGVCIDDHAAYVLTRQTREIEGSIVNTSRLLRVDLSGQETTELWSQKQDVGTNYFLVGSLNGWLVLKKIQATEEDMAKQVQSQRHTLYLVSPVNGSLTELYSWKQGDALELPFANELFLITEDHTLGALTDNGDYLCLAEDPILSPDCCSLQYADPHSLWITFASPENGTVYLYQVNRQDGILSKMCISDTIAVDILGEYLDMLFVKVRAGRTLEQNQNIQYAFLPTSTTQNGTTCNLETLSLFSQ